MEGAAWFGRNAVHTTDRLSASVAQIVTELRNHVSEDDDVGDDVRNLSFPFILNRFLLLNFVFYMVDCYC
jgi:hypothetical protein